MRQIVMLIFNANTKVFKIFVIFYYILNSFVNIRVTQCLTLRTKAALENTVRHNATGIKRHASRQWTLESEYS